MTGVGLSGVTGVVISVAESISTDDVASSVLTDTQVNSNWTQWLSKRTHLFLSVFDGLIDTVRRLLSLLSSLLSTTTSSSASVIM